MENEEIDHLKFCIRESIEMLFSLSGSAKQISLTALDLQALALSKKHQIEKAIDRVDDINDILGQLIEGLEKLICCYIARCDRVIDCQDQLEY